MLGRKPLMARRVTPRRPSGAATRSCSRPKAERPTEGTTAGLRTPNRVHEFASKRDELAQLPKPLSLER